ncbi:hypothetical protein [Anaerotruncus sp.]|jgi:hypothetical protein|uniref:hypothetical protein n=1 Tax=Anaerotruncus sp. TaxID=1872531 RepID=UPI002171ADDD|nr:hypothetical protein [Anaerotruncus sp.]MCI8491774.1 hypothetical protein [Anaerotruncus sp.]
MNKDNEKHFGLRVDGNILAKFRYVCGYAGRSANSQIIQLMLKFIAEYEKEHGKLKDTMERMELESELKNIQKFFASPERQTEFEEWKA